MVFKSTLMLFLSLWTLCKVSDLQCCLYLGLFQSWSSGAPRGNERWQVGTTDYQNPGKVQRVLGKNRVPEDGGEKVLKIWFIHIFPLQKYTWGGL
jgi:hypothetical protein